MPEYDAFGREIGEDPLAALRDAAVPARHPAESAAGEVVECHAIRMNTKPSRRER